MTAESAERKRGRPGHDRPAVLAAAIHLFITQGYEATSISDIAATLGVTKSAVYHHVTSKEELLAEAIDEALVQLEATVSAASESEGSSYDRLVEVVRSGVVMLAAHQPAVTLLLRVRGNTPLEQAALQRRRRLNTQLANLARAATVEGSLRGDIDPQVISRLLFGMVNSLVEWHVPGRTIGPNDLADMVVRVAFDSLHRPSR